MVSESPNHGKEIVDISRIHKGLKDLIGNLITVTNFENTFYVRKSWLTGIESIWNIGRESNLQESTMRNASIIFHLFSVNHPIKENQTNALAIASLIRATEIDRPKIKLDEIFLLQQAWNVRPDLVRTYRDLIAGDTNLNNRLHPFLHLFPENNQNQKAAMIKAIQNTKHKNKSHFELITRP